MLLASAIWITLGLNSLWQETLRLDCGTERATTCEQACGNRSFCEWTQTSCERCSGSSDPSLYAVYRSIPSVQPQVAQQPHRFFSELPKRSWMLFHPRSPYNYFSSPDEPQYASALNTACTRTSPGSQGLVVLATRKSAAHPWQADWLICVSEKKGAEIYPIVQLPPVKRTSSR